jgi:SpoVK/Ycf46/Vps4 family AAA+-type ATPase
MAGQQLKDIVKAFRRKDDAAFHAAVSEIIQEEQSKKHTALAADLQRLLGPSPVARDLPRPPTDKDTNLPLVTVRTPARGLDSIILAPDTRAIFDRLVTEARHGEQIDELGLRRRNRALLYGPPGCGKTSVVEALAHELGRPLVVARVEGLVNSHLGQTSVNLAKLFEYLETGDYVVLLDEFDAIGQSREKDDVGEMRRVVASLLQFIDGYKGTSIIIAATNHQEILDSALWRRFDAVAEMPLPSPEQIRGIIERLLPVRLKAATLEGLVAQLDGFPHSAVEYFSYGARRNALFDSRTDLNAADVAAAIAETAERRWS